MQASRVNGREGLATSTSQEVQLSFRSDFKSCANVS
jgi:hypothetical protein